MNKETAITAISEMPQGFDLDLLMEKLVFIEKVEKGLEQLKNGQTLTHQQVIEKIKEWQK
jgi:predicted transcriptional regulator